MQTLHLGLYLSQSQNSKWIQDCKTVSEFRNLEEEWGGVE